MKCGAIPAGTWATVLVASAGIAMKSAL